jgi:S-disulfanyl-L-cysteine oxidoreductase SoxD
MKRRIAVTAIALAAALAAQGLRSVWDGVYTGEQARRGAQAYGQKCSSCHGAELLGADEAPPLAGAQFLSNYNGQTADDLFERIRISMPADKPGSLGRQQIADVVAYIFRFNSFPAGPKELPTQAEVLKEIRVEATKPDNK